MRTLMYITAACAAGALAGAAHAQGQTSLSAGLGTTGLSIHAGRQIAPNMQARIGANFLRYNHGTSTGANEYDLRLRGQTYDGLLDWYPRESPFRVTAGVLYNDSKIDVNPRLRGGNYVFNGQAYGAGTVTDVRGDVDFRRWAPYLGVGWGNPLDGARRWNLSTDVGLIFTGNPDTRLSATCGTAVAAAAGGCAGLQANLAAEQRILHDKMSDSKVYPVIRVALSTQF